VAVTGGGCVYEFASSDAPAHDSTYGLVLVELKDYLMALRRRKLLVAAVTITTVVVAVAVTLLTPPTYTANSTVRIQPGTAFVAGTVRLDDLTYLDRLARTYSDLATNPQVVAAVRRRVGFQESPDFSVQQVPNTELMNVRATTSDPDTAAAAANALAAELIARVRALNELSAKQAERVFDERAAGLESEIASATEDLATLKRTVPTETSQLELLKLKEEIRSKRATLAALREGQQNFQIAQEARSGAVSLVVPASPPNHASNRHFALALALGLILGLLAGTGLAFLVERLTGRFRTSDEMEEAVKAPVLATIPHVGSGGSDAIFNSGSKGEEAFRRLATAFLAAGAKDSVQTVVVTSPEPAQGTSTIVANLGRALAQAGRTVLVVDANLRFPILHEFYGVPNEGGLSEALTDWPEDYMPEVLPTSVPRLWMLPAGSKAKESTKHLGSPQMERWLTATREYFDFVLLDAPAVLEVTDALSLARIADAVVLVARADTHRERFSSAHRELRRVHVALLGIVVNETSSRWQTVGSFVETVGQRGSGVGG
jgi:capsular exopolysaccharide synthesis family protein